MRPDGLAENFYFGGGSTVTTLTPVTWGVLLLASVIIFVLPRRYVIAPFLLVGLLLTTWPQLVVGGMHLAIYRMLIMAGWLRMLLRRDRDARPMSSLDKAVLAWAIVNAVMYSLLWGADAIGNRLGFLLNTCGTYFLARYLIRDREDILRGVKILAVVSLVIAGFMVNEHATGHNAFSIMGGVPEISDARAGGFRAQGPFAHSIVAGTFGAVLLPLFRCPVVGRQQKPAFGGVRRCVLGRDCIFVRVQHSSGDSGRGSVGTHCVAPEAANELGQVGPGDLRDRRATRHE